MGFDIERFDRFLRLVVKYRITYPSGKQWTERVVYKHNIRKSRQDLYDEIRWVKSLKSDASLEILEFELKTIWECS